MAGPFTSLPPVKPLSCQSQLTFTEFNRVISDLMVRDRVLEEALINFTSVSSLQRTASLLDATELILGPDLVADVISTGALPGGFQDFATFQAAVADRLSTLENNTIITDEDGENPKSLKALVLSNQQTLASVNQQIDEFDKELESIKSLTDDITEIKAVVSTVNTRITDLENLVGDLADEVKNARKELAADPSKRLVDKIDAIDSAVLALQTTLNSVVKELVDARSADRFDSVAERIGELESNLEAMQDMISNLQGRGIVTGVKVGRSILHGVTELIPGSNIAITRERNGLRIDVVEKATCIDMTAPIGDSNAACCGPSNVTIGELAVDLFKLLVEAIENPAPQGQMTPEAFVQGFHGIIKHFMAAVLKQPESVKRILGAKARGLEMAFWDAVNKTYPGLWAKLGRNNQLQLETAVRDYYAPQFMRKGQELLQANKPSLSAFAAQKPARKPIQLRSVMRQNQPQTNDTPIPAQQQAKV